MNDGTPTTFAERLARARTAQAERYRPAPLAWLQVKAHALLDRIWCDGIISREESYERLAHRMGMSADECHFARMEARDLQRAIRMLEDDPNLEQSA